MEARINSSCMQLNSTSWKLDQRLWAEWNLREKLRRLWLVLGSRNASCRLQKQLVWESASMTLKRRKREDFLGTGLVTENVSRRKPCLFFFFSFCCIQGNRTCCCFKILFPFVCMCVSSITLNQSAYNLFLTLVETNLFLTLVETTL